MASKINGKTRAHIFISGFVQGVFFRETTRTKAENLGIKGWVRNLRDSRVEAIFEGEKDKVEEILKWAKKGPSFARVDYIKVEWQKYEGKFDSFEAKYD